MFLVLTLGYMKMIFAEVAVLRELFRVLQPKVRQFNP